MVLGTVLAFLQVGGAEFIVIAIVALVVLGPERLPIALRKVGQVVGQVRSLSDGFRKEVQSAMDEVTEPVRTMTRPQLTALEGGAATFSAAPQSTVTADADPGVEASQADAGAPTAEMGAAEATPAALPVADVAAEVEVDPAAPPLVTDVVPEAPLVTDVVPEAPLVTDVVPEAPPTGEVGADPTVADEAPPKPRTRKPAASRSAAPATKKPAARKPAARKPPAPAATTPKPRAPRKPRPKPADPAVDPTEPMAPPEAADAERPAGGGDA